MRLANSQASPASAPSSSVGSVIPRTIFTFWDEATYPELVAACFASMRKFNPHWGLTILHSGTHLLPPPPHPPRGSPALTPQQTADWYRISALATYGGVWMDASALSVGSVDQWVNLSAP
ncbi:MAG: hypothetical protein SGPRY_005369, partial [Prymnesium sp.]